MKGVLCALYGWQVQLFKPMFLLGPKVLERGVITCYLKVLNVKANFTLNLLLNEWRPMESKLKKRASVGDALAS